MKAFAKIISISIIGLAVTSALVFFGIFQLLAQVNNYNDEVKQKKVDLATLDEQISAFKAAKTDLARAERKDDIAAILGPKENLVVAVQELERAAVLSAGAEELQLQEIIVNAKAKPVINDLKGIKEVPYTVKLEGSYQAMLNFQTYMEHLPHFTEITNIDLTPEGSAVDKLLHTGTIIGSFRGVFFVEDK